MPSRFEPIFTISLEKGLADRHRLPIGQVISVLNEVRQMLVETGREILRERGSTDSANVDFGLELIADEDGKAFKKGSFRAKIAITANVEVGVEAAQRVLETVSELGTPIKKPIARIAQGDLYRSKIINRLDKITYIHEKAKVDAKFGVSIPKSFRKDDANHAGRKVATFGSAAVKRLATLREPVFVESDVELYGKLIELRDRSHTEESGGKFWGELQRDNGEKWRVEFSDSYHDKAVPLFRRQVTVTGDAYYFQTRTPKLVAKDVAADEQRDYVQAFDELFGANKDLYKADLKTLLANRYGG